MAHSSDLDDAAAPATLRARAQRLRDHADRLEQTADLKEPLIKLLCRSISDGVEISFVTVPYGELVAVACGMRVTAVDCENDWFRTGDMDDPIKFDEVALLHEGRTESMMQFEEPTLETMTEHLDRLGITFTKR